MSTWVYTQRRPEFNFCQINFLPTKLKKIWSQFLVEYYYVMIDGWTNLFVRSPQKMYERSISEYICFGPRFAGISVLVSNVTVITSADIDLQLTQKISSICYQGRKNVTAYHALCSSAEFRVDTIDHILWPGVPWFWIFKNVYLNTPPYPPSVGPPCLVLMAYVILCM